MADGFSGRPEAYPGEGFGLQGESQRERALPEAGETSDRDDVIREEICETLTRHPGLDASGLEVNVEGGEVTLTGTVEDRDARWLAEDLVESVAGVGLVHNRLRVSPGR